MGEIDYIFYLLGWFYFGQLTGKVMIMAAIDLRRWLSQRKK